MKRWSNPRTVSSLPGCSLVQPGTYHWFFNPVFPRAQDIWSGVFHTLFVLNSAREILILVPSRSSAVTKYSSFAFRGFWVTTHSSCDHSSNDTDNNSICAFSPTRNGITQGTLGGNFIYHLKEPLVVEIQQEIIWIVGTDSLHHYQTSLVSPHSFCFHFNESPFYFDCKQNHLMAQTLSGEPGIDSFNCWPGWAWPPLLLLLLILTQNVFGHTARSLITEPLWICVCSSQARISKAGLSPVWLSLISTLRQDSNLRLQLDYCSLQGSYLILIIGKQPQCIKIICTPTLSPP